MESSDEFSSNENQMEDSTVVTSATNVQSKSQTTKQHTLTDSDAESSAEDVVNEDSDEQSAVTLSERELIRKQISTMSFEELQKLKQKIGSKEFNHVAFGVKSKKAPVSFKRANKNRPREMSAKKPIRVKDQSLQIKKNVPRDPRFDPLCGTYDEKVFKSNYKFLKDVRKKERDQLEKEYKKETDPKRQKKIKFLIQRINNQIREAEKRDKQKQNAEEEQKDIRKKLKQGEKPVYKKKSEKRIEELVNKYEELKKNNKLEKHLERRYKKLAKKDRKTVQTDSSAF